MTSLGSLASGIKRQENRAGFLQQQPLWSLGAGLGLLPVRSGSLRLPVPGRRGREAGPEDQLLLAAGGAV